MEYLKIFCYIILSFITVDFVDAATIHGIVYDLSLKKVNNARVDINTSPKQFLIAQNGTYSFNVPNGKFTINAQLMQKNTILASVQENITIKQEGNYVLDLILFPDIEKGVEDIDIEVNNNIVELYKDKRSILIWFFVLATLIITLIILYFYIKKKKQKKGQIKSEQGKKEEKSEDNDLEQITKIIGQEGGRTTQKEIRKQIPLSEAKISLMIAELEHKGVIEKIKKGRGNILILRKK